MGTAYNYNNLKTFDEDEITYFTVRWKNYKATLVYRTKNSWGLEAWTP